MKFKWITAGCMALIWSIGMFSTAVFAFVDETAVEDTPLQQSEQLEESADEPMQALTPDGNLTLVDDEGDVPKAGKQFITVVTKTGNYFYLIIDRDDDGKETVHFLNQVDEADLLKLMDEEELEQLAPEKEQEPEPEPEPEPAEPQPEEDTETKSNPWPAILVMLGLAGGGGFFAYKKWQEKQAEKEQVKPDPDADYVDDDEDFGYNQDEDTDEEMDGDETKDETLM